jgi:hypothetical protein
MTYQINRTDGTLLTNLQDLTKDNTTTSLTLLGRGAVDYGESVAENFVQMLENFASPTPPTNPLQGQLWYHTYNAGPPVTVINKLKIYDGTDWIIISTSSSSTSEPENPQVGDLWYNTSDNTMYYWDGTSWKAIGGPYTGLDPDTDPSTLDPDTPIDPPADPSEGQLWWMLPERVLWAYDSALTTASFPPKYKRVDGSYVPNGWVLIGPNGIQDSSDPDGGTYNVSTTITGLDPTTGEEKEYQIQMIVVNGKIITVWSDEQFKLSANSINGMNYGSWIDPFDSSADSKVVNAGLNMNHDSGFVMYGQSTDSERVNGLNGSQFLRSDISTAPLTTDTSYDLGDEDHRWRRFYAAHVYAGTSTPGSSGTNDTSSINLHGKAASAASADSTDAAKYFTNDKKLTTSNTNNTVATDNDVSVVFDNLFGDNSTNTYYGTASFTTVGTNQIKSLATTVAQNLIDDIPTGNFVPLNKSSHPTQNNTYNQGTASSRWATIYATTFNGTATAAQLADLAERYETDQVSPVGTLMSIGGEKEVTQTSGDKDYSYFGVVSENPGFLLNETAGNDDTHPAIALAGRVKVRVNGPVKKGQRIKLSVIPGVADAVNDIHDVDPMLIVGRALETIPNDGEHLVLCTVGAK